MNRLVFDYRTRAYYALVAFFGVFTGGWFFQSISGWRKDDQPYLSLAVGVCLVAGEIAFVVYGRNHRILVSGNRISWLDWLGRVKVDGAFSSVQILEPGGEGRFKRVFILTDGGLIRIWSTINHFVELRNLLAQEAQRAVREGAFPLTPDAPFVPEGRTYVYRWGMLHVMSFLFAGVVVMMDLGGWPHMLYEQICFVLGEIVGIVLVVGLQLKSLNESIRLDRDGIQWIDVLGRVKLRARLDQVTGVDESWSGDDNEGFIKIHTTQGDVLASSFLRRSGQLIYEVLRVVKDRG